MFAKWQLKEYRIRKGLWIILFLAGTWGIALLGEWGQLPYIVTAALWHIVIALLILTGFQGTAGKKMLVLSVLLLTKELLGHFSGSLISCLTLVLLHSVQGGEMIGIGWELDQLIGYLSYLVVILFLWFSKGVLAPVFCGKSDKWYGVLSLPLLFLLVLIDVVNQGASNGIMVVSYRHANIAWGGYQNQIFSHFGICLLTGICFVLAACLVLGMNRIDREQKKQEQYRMQTTFYEMIAEQYESSERLRHDMKNHILSLQALWEDRDWERMGSYLGQMQKAGSAGGEDITGNRVADALLHYKKKKAEECGISWECDISPHALAGMDEFDLCVLLGNLLDNALAAASVPFTDWQPFVGIQGSQVNKCFFLQVKNSTARRTLQGLQEGTGLSNVRDVVERYDGAMDLELQDGVFMVSVLLQKIPDKSDN